MGKKTCLCNAVHCQKVLLRKLFPFMCITVFHLSLFVSVCTLCILPLLWKMINISVKCHFSSRPVYSPCLHQGLEMSCPWIHPCRRMRIHAQQWTYMPRHTLHHATCTHFTTSAHTAGPTNHFLQLSKLPSWPMFGPAAPARHAHL